MDGSEIEYRMHEGIKVNGVEGGLMPVIHERDFFLNQSTPLF